MHWLFVVVLAFINLPLALGLTALFLFLERR
jgi:hypothetical protein